MMLVVEGRVAEKVLTAQRGQLADVGLDLLGAKVYAKSVCVPDFTTHS